MTQSNHSRRTVPTKRSATALAFGARIGVRMTRRGEQIRAQDLPVVLGVHTGRHDAPARVPVGRITKFDPAPL